MFEQVNAALRSVKIEPKDAATAELARHYAHLMDNPAPHAKYAEALGWLAGVETNIRTEKLRLIIETALSEHSAASDFGPKLLAALTALGMTPAAAGGVVTPKQEGPKSPLDELRIAREKRDNAG